MSLSSAAKLVVACILPIALLEAGTQYLGGVGPLGPLGSATLTESHGLQYPSRCARNHFGRLYRDGDSVVATLCSDAYGTIEPTSLSALVEARSPGTVPYILACGGSTTESAPIEQQDRWVTVLSERLGVAAINAGASAKTMATCARTLDFLLRRAPPGRPPLILITTSVNTLGHFVAAATAPNWDRVTLPAQHFAPQPLHPELRAWIPGLYHLAAILVSWLDSGPSGRPYTDGLIAGCCHVPAAVNRSPAQRFDWDDEANRQLYARFVAANLERIEAVLERHGVARERVVFIEEANAYGHPAMPHTTHDFRQRLHGLDGKALDWPTAAAVTARYDEVYVQVVAQRFDVIRAETFDLPPTAFYDAVHLTPSGARAYAERLAEILRTQIVGAAEPMP